MRKSILLWLALAAAVACGGGDAVGPGGDRVGGRCGADGDCEHRCLQGGDWPGGHCTVGCVSDRDCPGGTFCVDKAGGVCLLSCAEGQNCGKLGPGYFCGNKNRRGDGKDKILVCVAD